MDCIDKLSNTGLEHAVFAIHLRFKQIEHEFGQEDFGGFGEIRAVFIQGSGGRSESAVRVPAAEEKVHDWGDGEEKLVDEHKALEGGV